MAELHFILRGDQVEFVEKYKKSKKQDRHERQQVERSDHIRLLIKGHLGTAKMTFTKRARGARPFMNRAKSSPPNRLAIARKISGARVG